MTSIKMAVMLLTVLNVVFALAATPRIKQWTVNVIFRIITDHSIIKTKVKRAGNSRNYVLPDVHKDLFLATALTAQAVGLRLEIEIDDWNAEGNMI